MTFSIAHIDHEGRKAKIQVNDFTEMFETDGDWNPGDLDKFWIEQLKRIEENTGSVLLPVWVVGDQVSRGWVAYRIDNQVHIQDQLFSDGFDLVTDQLPPREIKNDDGSTTNLVLSGSDEDEDEDEDRKI